jgi:hypothetical protein
VAVKLDFTLRAVECSASQSVQSAEVLGTFIAAGITPSAEVRKSTAVSTLGAVTTGLTSAVSVGNVAVQNQHLDLQVQVMLSLRETIENWR